MNFNDHWKTRRTRCRTWDAKNEENRHLYTWLSAMVSRDEDNKKLRETISELILTVSNQRQHYHAQMEGKGGVEFEKLDFAYGACLHLEINLVKLVAGK